jgi:penicillin-binding protein 1B
VTSAGGNTLEKFSPVNKQVLDPRVAYLVDSVLQDVLNRGTGAAVRQKGFTLPAAGKTGTSRDGWFSGFTTDLVCVIWVGFDDNHDLGLTGGVAVAPIWADFMIKATKLPGYRNAGTFEKPEGVDSTVIDPESLQVATPSCPTTREEVYVAGSEPKQLCELHGGHGPATASGSFLSHIFGGGSPKPPTSPGDPNAPAAEAKTPGQGEGNQSVEATKAPEKKKSAFQKIFGIFGDKKKKEPEKPPPDKGDSP